jgi:hypothetical protein
VKPSGGWSAQPERQTCFALRLGLSGLGSRKPPLSLVGLFQFLIGTQQLGHALCRTVCEVSNNAKAHGHQETLTFGGFFYRFAFRFGSGLIYCHLLFKDTEEFLLLHGIEIG